MNFTLGTSVRFGPRARIVAARLAFGLAFAAPAPAEPTIFPTGVTVYDPARAYNSYVLYAAGDGATHLIDMNGNEVRRWKESGAPSKMLDPVLTGGVRGQIGVQLSGVPAEAVAAISLPGMSRNQTIGVVDWNDLIVWEWGKQAPGAAARQHHAWQRLPNGNTMIQVHVAQELADFDARRMIDNVVYEVNRKGALVWKWNLSEHLGEFGFTEAGLALVHASRDRDYFHVNDVFVLGPNRWAKAGDDRFTPGNLVMVSFSGNVAAIVSRRTGRVVWRIGPDFPASSPMAAKPTPRAVDQILGAHSVQMIAEGLPGAGNLLIFDNRGGGGYPPVPTPIFSGSRVIELDPVRKTIVWEYTARSSGQPDWQFFSPLASSAERLPNGNTLISEAINGRFFQVTPSGDIVWEYITPVTGPAPMQPLQGRSPPMTHFTFRIQAVPYDWVPSGTPHSEKAVAVIDVK